MRNPKFGRGDTIKLLTNVPFPRASGSLFVIRNVFSYSNLNDTVKENLQEHLEVSEDTPVYYCSDEINYNCFVPESCLVRWLLFKKEKPLVEEASLQDKMYFRVAMVAEAARKQTLHRPTKHSDYDEEA